MVNVNGNKKKNNWGARESKYLGLEGKQFGSWTVLKLIPYDPKIRMVEYKCKCDCGTIKTIRADYLFRRINKDGKLSCLKCWRTKRARKNQDLVGKKIGNWLVLELINNGETKYKCECQCERKTIRIMSAHHLFSCDKCKFCLGAYNKRNCWTGCGELSGRQWSKYVWGAKKRKIKFNITVKYAWNLFLQQNRQCAISGLPIQFKPNTRSPYSELTASLDRIDSSKGYINGNVQWIYKEIQQMKWDLDEEYFIDMCNIIANYQNQKIKLKKAS